MQAISRLLRSQVEKRAGHRCEYCQLSNAGQEATFHIDHVVPRIASGPTTIENLALACVSCSLRKGARQTAMDPRSGQILPLFNPRTQRWSDHFRWDDLRIKARTPIGRVTIQALALNRPQILGIRREEFARDRHPPR